MIEWWQVSPGQSQLQQPCSPAVFVGFASKQRVLPRAERSLRPALVVYLFHAQETREGFLIGSKEALSGSIAG
jgi:hypothetical protein